MLYYVRNEENRIKHYARRMFAIAYSASLMLVTPLAEAVGRLNPARGDPCGGTLSFMHTAGSMDF